MIAVPCKCSKINLNLDILNKCSILVCEEWRFVFNLLSEVKVVQSEQYCVTYEKLIYSMKYRKVVEELLSSV